MGVDTPTPVITPAVLVSDYININSGQIVDQVFPLNNFGFIKNMPTLIQMDFHYFLLYILNLEYGDYYINAKEQKLFKNTYTQSFWRLIQLMSLDSLVDMTVLLKNNFQSEEYVANVSQNAGISTMTGSGNESVNAQATVENESESTTLNNYKSGSSDNSTASGNTDATTTYVNQSNDESRSNATSVIGATSSIGVSLAIPLPTQTNGVTANLPLISGTAVDNNGVGVPQLNQSFSDSATQQSGYNSSQTNTDESVGTAIARSNSDTRDTSTNTTQSQSESDSFSDGVQTHTGNSNQVDVGTTTVETNTSNESQNKAGSSGFVGSRRKGFTTNAIVATQLLAMLKGYQEINTALEWWTEQFRWIEPILGMDYWDTDLQMYV